MKKIGMLMIICLLLSAPFAAAIFSEESDTDSGTRGTTIDVALVHFNVTYQNGSPAEYVYINIHPYNYLYYYTYRDHDKTDQYGNATIPVSNANYGLSQITIHDFDLNYFWMTPIFIGPDDEIYMDVVLTEKLPSDLEVTGVVRNENLTPMENVEVRITGYDSLGLLIDVNDTTGADGVYSIFVPEPRDYYSLYAPIGLTGYYGMSPRIYLDDETMVYPFDIDLYPVKMREVPVQIRLLNTSTQEPIFNSSLGFSGRNAEIYHAYDYPMITGKTDSEGIFDVNLSKGEWHVYWSEIDTMLKNGSITASMPFLVNSTNGVIDFPVPVFNQYRKVWVNLTDKDTGVPIGPQYRVYSRGTVENEEGVDVSFEQRDETNSQGLADFMVPANADFEIEFTGWNNYTSKIVSVQSGPPTEDVVLNVGLEEIKSSIIPKGNISVHLIDGVSGIGLYSEYVWGNGDYEDHNVFFSGYTDIEGYLNLTDIPLGTYDLKSESKLGNGLLEGEKVLEGVDNEFTIEIVRKTIPDPDPFVEILLVDTLGNPISGCPVMFRSFVESYHYHYDTFSDSQGVIHMILPPGDYEAYIPEDSWSTSKYQFRNLWVMETTEITIDEHGNSVSEFTAYDSDSLDPISGFIRDMDTGEVISYQDLTAESTIFIGDTGTRMMMPQPAGDTPKGEDYLRAFYQEFESITSGYYRVWGRDQVDITCEREGYFPYLETIDMTTRSPAELDIYLELLEEYTTWLNGTLTDQNDDPIPGTINVIDTDRDMYAVNGMNTTDGVFNLSVYPGNFRVEFNNDTLSDSIEITVPEGGIANLSLILIPRSMIKGSVTDWNDTLLEGINVTLQGMVSVDVNETVDWMKTGSDGVFNFDEPEGSYRIFIGKTDLYDPYTGDLLEADGWNEFVIDIMLGNRTMADITGIVTGSGGPLADGIPDAEVFISNSTGHMITSAHTDETGMYVLEDVPHRKNLTIRALPQISDQPRPEFYRSGYNISSITGINVIGSSMEIDIELEYLEFTPPDYLNVTSFSPSGENISQNELIFIMFNHPINMTSFESGFGISPDPGNVRFDHLDNTSIVWIDHDLFDGFTTYTVTLDGSIISESGYPMWSSEGFTWNFTTINISAAWALFSSDVTHDEGKAYDVMATGMGFLEVYMVIDGIDSYLMTETSIGIYKYHLDGSMFQWDTFYTYHFSDRIGGPDLAPLLASGIQTPAEPAPTDPITSVDIRDNDDGSWLVEVMAEAGKTLYIVIEDVGSFLLKEIVNGTYRVIIAAGQLDDDTTYDYYFSDSPDGIDISPNRSGSFDTDSTTTSSDDEDNFLLYCCGIPLVVLLVLIIVIIIIIVIASKGKDEADWGEE